MLPRSPTPPLCAPLAALGTAALLAAQSVVQVTPGATIQAAINAAVDGDVIAVAPGSYPEFSIGDVQLSVVGVDPATGQAATFTVVPTGTGPAIAVAGLTGGRRVTVAGARLTHASATAPAIAITGNVGHVRLLDVVVAPSAALGTVAYEGLVEVRATTSAWFEGVRAGDNRWFGMGLSGLTALCGVVCDRSSLLLDDCAFEGLRSSSALQPGGDGLRIRGASPSLQLTDTRLVGGRSAAGLNPGTAGGHALHDFDGQSGPFTFCDCSFLVTVNTVPWYGVMGGPGPYVTACAPETVGRTDLAPAASSLPLGATATVAIDANVGGRAYAAIVGVAFGYATGVAWNGVWVADGPMAVLTVGALPATGTTAFAFVLPAVPAAAGVHWTVQAVLAPAGQTGAWTFTTPAGLTLR